MARKIYKGKNLRIFVGGKALLHSTECGFSTSTNFESIATKDTNGNVQTPGNYEWSVTANTLFVDKDVLDTDRFDTLELLEQYLAQEEVTIQFMTNIGQEVVIAGSAYMSGVNFSAPTEGSATGDFSFQGNGDFTATRLAAAGSLSVISSANVIDIENGTGGTFSVTASNTPTGYELVGTVPAGVTINATTGVITFTDAVAVGNYLGIYVRVTNAYGVTEQQIAIIVTAP